MLLRVLYLTCVVLSLSNISTGQLDDFFTTEPTIYFGSTTAPKTVTEQSQLTKCDTSTGPGECVKSELCVNGRISTGGGTRIRPRDGGEFCEADEVCCLPPEGATEEPTEPTIPTTTETIITPGVQTGCGWRHEEGIGDRISDGLESLPSEFPWTVAILKAKSNGLIFKFGGSLIHPEVVLTSGVRATAYIYHEAELRVRAGVHDLQDSHNNYLQTSNVKSMVIHPQRSTVNFTYNIALLFLATPIKKSDAVNFACLPPPTLLPEPGYLCTATGWGRESKLGLIQSTQKKAELTVLSNADCLPRIRKAKKNNFFPLDATSICAVRRTGDTCNGDGGGPFMCPYKDPAQDGRYYQAGVVSMGVDCGESGAPGLYASVAFLRPWIDNEVRAKGLTTDTYTYIE